MDAIIDTIILEEKPEAGITLVNGREYMHDAKGNLVPVANIKPEDKLEDEMVRKVIDTTPGRMKIAALLPRHPQIGHRLIEKALELLASAKTGASPAR